MLLQYYKTSEQEIALFVRGIFLEDQWSFGTIYVKKCLNLADTKRLKNISCTFRYLTEEWKIRKADFGERIYNRCNMRCIVPCVPQQGNNSDCGLFLLHYAEKIFQVLFADCDVQAFNFVVKYKVLEAVLG